MIDADVLGHQAIEKQHVKEQLTAEFGDGILLDGEIHRPSLGKVVFGNERALMSLNAIVHPEIRSMIQHMAQDLQTFQYGLLDAALLHEANFSELCDLSICLDLDFEQRYKRVSGARGWSEQELINRDSAQDVHLKATRSDLVVRGAALEERLWPFVQSMDVALRYALAVGKPHRAMELLGNISEIKKI